MLLSNCVVCNNKKSIFTKDQETNELLSSLGIKTPLSQVLITGPILF